MEFRSTSRKYYVIKLKQHLLRKKKKECMKIFYNKNLNIRVITEEIFFPQQLRVTTQTAYTQRILYFIRVFASAISFFCILLSNYTVNIL